MEYQLFFGKWNYFCSAVAGSINKCNGHKTLQNIMESYHSCKSQWQVLQGTIVDVMKKHFCLPLLAIVQQFKFNTRLRQWVNL